MARATLLAGALLAGALAGCARPTTLADRAKDDLAVAVAERSADSLTARGRALARVGDLTRAEQYLSAALDVGASPERVLPELLRVCVAAERYRVAIAYAAPLLERHPRDPKLRFVVAALRARVGDSLGAAADLERVLADSPNEARAHFAYGVLLRDRMDEPGRADDEFRAYLRLEPQGPHGDAARAGLLEVVP